MLELDVINRDIEELKRRGNSWSDCEKFALLCIARDNLGGAAEHTQPAPERRAATEGDSEFLRAVKYKPTTAVMGALDEFMDGLKLVNPSMYNALIGKLNEI